jgi:protein MpaA
MKNAVVLCCNPDGLMRGTRGNAIGVDLNRNFPASNWSPDPVYYKSRRHDPQDIALSPGTHPSSEPETRALMAILDHLRPRAVVSLHAALACIDDANGSDLGRVISEMTGLPLQRDIGYPTPGSFGSWAQEQDLNVVTYEFEAASPYDLKDRHVPVLIELMTANVAFGG